LKQKIIPFPAVAWIPTAIAAAAVFGAFLFANTERLLPAETSLLAAEVASDHIRSLIGTHLIDVESSDEHTIKPWFAGKVDFSPPVLDFADQGFKLIGGRLDYVGGKNIAVLVYRFKEHYVSLFMYREPNSEPASKQKLLDYQGYNLVYWNVNGLDCWLSPTLRPGHLSSSSKFSNKSTPEVFGL
jgi:anti-sigma factor RsiW